MFATPILAALTLFLGLTQTGTDDSTRVRGTVTTGGVENRPIPNALVVAASDSDVRETRADASGRYVFLTLLPGVYRLSAYPSGAKENGPHATGAIFLVNASAASHRAVARCLEDAETLVELSAGVEYLANLDLIARCP